MLGKDVTISVTLELALFEGLKAVEPFDEIDEPETGGGMPSPASLEGRWLGLSSDPGHLRPGQQTGGGDWCRHQHVRRRLGASRTTQSARPRRLPRA